ncbi:MAG: peptidylprolyl isomerase [Chitinophagaceae bacterium]
MREKLLAVFLLFSISYSYSQTLFTYGKDSVSVKEFLAAYKKINIGVSTKNDKEILDFLDLYITSRLKIKEAKERGYDTLPEFLSDLQDLRTQILPSYLNDAETIEKLTKEAFTRSQKDIHVAHVFVGFTTNGRTDTTAALQKANEVYAKLQQGASFSEIAKKYSDDPSAQQNGGDVGYITVFTLPYELENVAYKTAIGKVSPAYKSKAGYHIFKNLDERKAFGRIKAAEILLAVPPGADAGTKTKIQKQADSLYNRIVKGADFGKLAAQFSNDVVSAASNGLMPEFGVGEFDPAFEKAVFALQKPGSTTKPFLTFYGYHIVKLLNRLPVNTNPNNVKAILALREKVEQNERINIAKTILVQKVLKDAGYKRSSFRDTDLWAYTDSVLGKPNSASAVNLSGGMALFKIGDKDATVNDWSKYAKTNAYKADGSGIKPYHQMWDEFVHSAALDFYKGQPETYNGYFAQQINEFKEGNLFFEIMQREIWRRGQSDSVALQQYYQQHQTKYRWNRSADAIIFQAPNSATANGISNELKKEPQNWRNIINNVNENITFDSGRFEITQIPNADKLPVKPGAVTSPLINKEDNTVSFAYIIKVYDQPSQRTLADAKGFVISDYQTELEKQWVAELRAKYPVKINQKVLAGLLVANKSKPIP